MLYGCINPATFMATNQTVAVEIKIKNTKFWGYKCPSDKCNLYLRKNKNTYMCKGD